MVECKLCGVSKAHKVILRRLLTRSTVPFYRIYLDLIPGIIIYNGDRHTAHFLNNVTRMNKVEIMAKKLSLPQMVINYCNVIKQKYSFKVAIIHTNKEIALRGNFKEYIAK